MSDFLVLLDRYRTGECTPAEARLVEQRLAADGNSTGDAGWMRDLASVAERWQASTETAQAATWKPDAQWNALRGAMSGVQADARRALTLLPAQPRRMWPMRLAQLAVAASLLLAGFAVWRTWGPHVAAPATARARTFESPRGQRAEFALADGSRVTLAPGSRLDVLDGYGASTRDVRLDGEGYFEVKPNPAVPFRVHSGRGITQVLGTKFGVRAYGSDSTETVVVAEGSVAFTSRSPSPASVVLAPGDLARLDRGDQVTVEHGVPVDRYLGWVTGRLAFVNAPLREVVPELERWYDIQIVVGDSQLAARPLTASFEKESAPHMLQLLGRTLDLRIESAGRAVVLRANP